MYYIFATQAVWKENYSIIIPSTLLNPYLNGVRVGGYLFPF